MEKKPCAHCRDGRTWKLRMVFTGIIEGLPLRCISKDIIPVSVTLKSTSNSRSRRDKEIIHRTERQLLQDRVKRINGTLCKNAIKLDRCRSRLLLVTTPMEKFTDFINKVGEFRFIKIKDRQVNKFNRLMGSKDREFTTKPLANNNQLQAQINCNKWEVYLSSTHPNPKSPFYPKDQIMYISQNPPI